jgi:hypothetical protein
MNCPLFWRVKITLLLPVRFFPASWLSSLFGSNITLGILPMSFLWPFLSVREQDLQPYKKAGKNIFLCILTLMLIYSYRIRIPIITSIFVRSDKVLFFFRLKPVTCFNTSHCDSLVWKWTIASQLTDNSESPAPFIVTKNKEHKSRILTLALCGIKDWL